MAGRKLAKIGSLKKVSGHRMLDGKEVVPVLYYGKPVGHGKYMSGKVNNEMICDSNGKPLPYRGIGVSWKEFERAMEKEEQKAEL